MFRAEDPLEHGQQRGVLVARVGPVSRLPGPGGELAPGGQGGRVLRAKDLFPCLSYFLLEIAGEGIAAAIS